MNKLLCLLWVGLIGCSVKPQGDESKLDSAQQVQGSELTTAPKANPMEAIMKFYFSDSTIAAKNILSQVYTKQELKELSDSTWELSNLDYNGSFNFEGELVESSGACTPGAVLMFIRTDKKGEEPAKYDWILMSGRKDGSLLASRFLVSTDTTYIDGADTIRIESEFVWDYLVKTECNILAQETITESRNTTFYTLDNKKLKEVFSGTSGSIQILPSKTKGLFDIALTEEGGSAEFYKWNGEKYQSQTPGQ